MYDSWEPSDTCLTFCSLATSIGTQRWSENPIERKHQLIGNHIVCEDSHWMAPSLAGHEIQQSAGSFNEIVRSRKFISTTVAAIAHACCWWVLRVSWSGYISVVQAWHEQVKWAPYSPRVAARMPCCCSDYTKTWLWSLFPCSASPPFKHSEDVWFGPLLCGHFLNCWI